VIRIRLIYVSVLLCGSGFSVLAQPPDGNPADPDRLLESVKAYADTLVVHGRDTYGDVHSPLFAAALDREHLALLDGPAMETVLAIPREEWGIRPHDRTLTGANPMQDEHLYMILYALSEITEDPQYKAAADDALRYFFTNCQSPVTGLFAWGEHIGWDFHAETRIDRPASDTHEFYRPWVLWTASYELAREPMKAFAHGVWEHQVGDHRTGNFSRHASFSMHKPGTNSEYPRHGGFYIATWARAYDETGDPEFLHAIDTLVNYFESRRNPETGAIPSESADRSKGTLMWPPSNVSLAVDLHNGAQQVPRETAERMQACATAIDGVFLRLPHAPGPGGKGFVTLADTKTLGGETASYADTWATGYGDHTVAQVANLCLLRYHQEPADGYRQLILDAADRYLDSDPPADIHVYPGALGDAICLLVGAHGISKDAKYLDRADALAREAQRMFLNDGCPLPRASSKANHYEAITRVDTLMLGLLKLWVAHSGRQLKTPLVYADR
jgi:hypothetical protein